jgi:hypothetical protein
VGSPVSQYDWRDSPLIGSPDAQERVGEEMTFFTYH